MMKKSTKSRIDKLLVERGLVKTRTKAQALIMAGRIIVGLAYITVRTRILTRHYQPRLLFSVEKISAIR